MCCQSETLAPLLDFCLDCFLLGFVLLLAAYQKTTITGFIFLKSGFISDKTYFFTHVFPKKHFEGKRVQKYFAFKYIL